MSILFLLLFNGHVITTKMGLFNISSYTTSVYFIIVFIIINNILLKKVLKQNIYDCLYRYTCKMCQSVYTSCLLCIII